MDIEKKREILQAAKTEIMRHRWDTFVDDPPSIAQGGRGAIVSGCPTCKKRFGTNPPRSLSDPANFLGRMRDRESDTDSSGAGVIAATGDWIRRELPDWFEA